jgi:hypothetical protein
VIQVLLKYFLGLLLFNEKWFVTVVGDRDGYISGKFGQNFAPNLKAVFSWPAEDANDVYIAICLKLININNNFDALIILLKYSEKV